MRKTSVFKSTDLEKTQIKLPLKGLSMPGPATLGQDPVAVSALS